MAEYVKRLANGGLEQVSETESDSTSERRSHESPSIARKFTPSASSVTYASWLVMLLLSVLDGVLRRTPGTVACRWMG